MRRSPLWLVLIVALGSGCSGGGGDGENAGGSSSESACELSSYCVMLTSGECDERGGVLSEEQSCEDLSYDCQDDDRFYSEDDPDCPTYVEEPDEQEDTGRCVRELGDARICSITTEASCFGTFDALSGACSEADYAWGCDEVPYTHYNLLLACQLGCESTCEHIGEGTEPEIAACTYVYAGVNACSELPEDECTGTFTSGSTCADEAFDWTCSAGRTFESQVDCIIGCSGGCQGDDAPPIGSDPNDGVPAAGGVIGVEVVGKTELTLDFEIDVFVIDNDGDLIAELDAGDLDFQDEVFDWDVPAEEDPFFSFTQTCFEAMQTPENGPYSAIMLMDQSGSISTTDPGDTRIEAAKIFFDALGSEDEAILAAFASAGSLMSDFVSWGMFGQAADYDSTLDSFTSLEGGGTPLFDATVVYTDKVAAEGNNENKAVIVFTDGEDTESTAGLAQAAENATSKGVKLFTVGLSDAVDRGVLQQLAFQTGGSMMYTDDASNLVALYGTLGNLLSGGVAYYHTCWTVERDKQDFSAGTFNTSMRVERSDGNFAYVPVHVTY